RRSYPVSAVLRTSPPPQSARPLPRGRPVDPVIPNLTTLWGFPCCARFPCVRAAASTPVQRLGVVFAHLAQPYQPSPITLSGRPAHRPFRGLLSVHSRCGPHANRDGGRRRRRLIHRHTGPTVRLQIFVGSPTVH